MPRLTGWRYLIIATLVFAVGAIDVAAASSALPTQNLHRQDLGDDDGDGIPNYLDPDDNNDGTQDSDTPDPAPVPTTTPEGDPDDETPVPDDSGVPADDSNQTEQPVDSPAPVVSEPVAQVSSLPNTGTGLQEFSGGFGITSLLLALFTTSLVAAKLKWKLRMP